MPDILIHNVPQDILDALEQQAETNNRSLEQELLMILRSTAKVRRIPSQEEREAESKKIRAIRHRLAASGRDFGDSAQDQREDRER